MPHRQLCPWSRVTSNSSGHPTPRCPRRVPALSVTLWQSCSPAGWLASPLWVTLSFPCCSDPSLQAHLPWLLAAAWFFLSRGLEAESAWESGQSSGLAWNKAVLGPQLSSPGTRWVWGRALTRLSPADLENHQHARALACRRASLCCLPGARVQDS